MGIRLRLELKLLAGVCCNLSQHYPPVAQGHIEALNYIHKDLNLECQIHSP